MITLNTIRAKLGTTTTNQNDLEEWAHTHLSTFQGTIARDEPPLSYGAWIVNIDRKKGPGSHWTAAYIPPTGPWLYADSYGFPPPRLLQKHAQAARASILYPDVALQGRLDEDCGPRSLYALHLMETRGRDALDILGAE